MQKLHDLTAWAESRRELWLDCVRIYLGLGLFARGLLLICNVRTDFFVNLLSHSDEPAGSSRLRCHALRRPGALCRRCDARPRFAHTPRRARADPHPCRRGFHRAPRQDGLLATLGHGSLEFSALVLFLLCVICVSGARPALPRPRYLRRACAHDEHEPDGAALTGRLEQR